MTHPNDGCEGDYLSSSRDYDILSSHNRRFSTWTSPLLKFHLKGCFKKCINCFWPKSQVKSDKESRDGAVRFGFDSRTQRHMRVEFVVGSRPCSEGFSPGSPVFLSSKTNISKFQFDLEHTFNNNNNNFI